MKLRWTESAYADLRRLYEFLEGKNPVAAHNTVSALLGAAEKLQHQPRTGTRLDAFEGREVRRFIVAQYELRYEISTDTAYILRIFHGREDR